jgi:nucleotide-binding universal stress UspA family protein
VGLLPSADSRRALRAGAALARAAGVPLLVLIVLRRSPSSADAAALAARLAPPLSFRSEGPPAEILRAAIIAAAREDGAEPDEWSSAGELDVEPLILIGDAADALLRASGRLGVLVLGSRAYGPPGVVLPGGAARRVLANARCPVLMVPRAPVAVRVPA